MPLIVPPAEPAPAEVVAAVVVLELADERVLVTGSPELVAADRLRLLDAAHVQIGRMEPR